MQQHQIVLTDRDIELFQLIHEEWYLAYSHIKMVWPKDEEAVKACYLRVTGLVDQGYLKQHYSKRMNLHVYFLTQPALDELCKRKLDSGLPLYKFDSNFDPVTAHDLCVITVRITFQSLGLKNWTSQRILKEKERLFHMPDGILTIKNLKIAVEYDGYLQSMKTYIRLFDFYRQRPDYCLVFFITDWNEWFLQDGLGYDYKRVWITSYTNFVAMREKTRFENYKAGFELSRILPKGVS